MFLYECFYKLYMLQYNSIDAKKPLVSASLLFVLTGNLLRQILNFNQMCAIVVLMKNIIIITTKCFLKNVCINNAKKLNY